MARYINADRLYPTNFEIYTYEGDYKRALAAVYEKIDNAPAEDVAPIIHAKWIKGRYCSNCECDDYDYCCRQPKYCPECGAKMEEE